MWGGSKTGFTDPATMIPIIETFICSKISWLCTNIRTFSFRLLITVATNTHIHLLYSFLNPLFDVVIQ